jgi:kynurenine 3-monooxygenase
MQCINSIDRGLLNEGLLEETASHDNIQIFFDHKVTFADFDTQTLVVRDIPRNTEIKVQFNFCVGADGSYSVIRRQLMRVMR